VSKLVQALLTGTLITFILDFFIFLGIKQNYIDFYDINVYYNILFADHQNIYIFTLCSIFLGLMVSYFPSKNINLLILSILSLLSLSTLFSSVGYGVGEYMLMSKNQTFRDAKHSFVGDVYYNARENIIFYDYELEKIITLQKKDLIK